MNDIRRPLIAMVFLLITLHVYAGSEDIAVNDLPPEVEREIKNFSTSKKKFACTKRDGRRQGMLFSHGYKEWPNTGTLCVAGWGCDCFKGRADYVRETRRCYYICVSCCWIVARNNGRNASEEGGSNSTNGKVISLNGMVVGIARCLGHQLFYVKMASIHFTERRIHRIDSLIYHWRRHGGFARGDY